MDEWARRESEVRLHTVCKHDHTRLHVWVEVRVLDLVAHLEPSHGDDYGICNDE